MSLMCEADTQECMGDCMGDCMRKHASRTTSGAALDSAAPQSSALTDTSSVAITSDGNISAHLHLPTHSKACSAAIGARYEVSVRSGARDGRGGGTYRCPDK